MRDKVEALTRVGEPIRQDRHVIHVEEFTMVLPDGAPPPAVRHRNPSRRENR